MADRGRFFWIVLLLGGLLASCKGPEVSGLTSFESTAVVHIREMPLAKGIDWNVELGLVSSPEVLEAAAKAVGVDAGALDEATKVEVQVEEGLVKITAEHEDEETARALAQALAEAYRDGRNEQALKFGEEQLDEINRQLLAQEEEVEKARQNLMKLVEDYQIPSSGEGATLEQDRMTYEKAKAALEEAGDDGVLFKKGEDE